MVEEADWDDIYGPPTAIDPAPTAPTPAVAAGGAEFDRFGARIRPSLAPPASAPAAAAADPSGSGGGAEHGDVYGAPTAAVRTLGRGLTLPPAQPQPHHPADPGVYGAPTQSQRGSAGDGDAGDDDDTCVAGVCGGSTRVVLGCGARVWC